MKTFSLQLKINGSDFFNKTLKILQSIPYGETLSYRDLAKLAGSPNAQRAIGTALSKNPILILLPCHKIICASQDIGSYIWGKNHKKFLINLEKSKNSNA